FGVRGGKKAYEAKLRSESVMGAEIAALEAEQEVAVEREVAAEGAAAGTPAPAAGTPAAAGPPWPDAGPPAPTGPRWPGPETSATKAPDADEADVTTAPSLPHRHPPPR